MAIPAPAGQSVGELLAPSHAKKLHELAGQISDLNFRISSFLDRMVGGVPQEAASNAKEAEPIGVIFVAQFGAEKIQRQIGVLSDQVARLEQIG